MRKLFLSILIFSAQISFAQNISLGFFNHPSNTSRTLLFGLPEDDDDWELTNDEITSIINQYWTATTNHQILRFSEAQAKAKEDKEKYAVAFFVTEKTTQDLRKGILAPRLENAIPPKGFHIEFICKQSTCYGGYFYTRNHITKYDLISTLMMAQFFYKNHDKFKSDFKILKASSKLFGAEIKTKTLLVDKKDVNASEEEIRKKYPYPFKLVDQSTIEKAIANRSTEYLIIHKGASELNRTAHLILNPSSGAIVSFNYATYDEGFATMQKNGLNANHFEDFISNAGL
jgi:hypothetical protein